MKVSNDELVLFEINRMLLTLGDYDNGVKSSLS
jgi:hypothetical protein